MTTNTASELAYLARALKALRVREVSGRPRPPVTRSRTARRTWPRSSPGDRRAKATVARPGSRRRSSQLSRPRGKGEEVLSGKTGR